jgi:hypothetical protein
MLATNPSTSTDRMVKIDSTINSAVPRTLFAGEGIAFCPMEKFFM